MDTNKYAQITDINKLYNILDHLEIDLGFICATAEQEEEIKHSISQCISRMHEIEPIEDMPFDEVTKLLCPAPRSMTEEEIEAYERQCLRY